MPYSIIYRKGAKRPYKIKNLQTGQIVGSSMTKAQAGRSIGYREEVIAKSGKKKIRAKVKKVVKRKIKAKNRT